MEGKKGLIWTNKDFTKELVAKGRDLEGPIRVECWEKFGSLYGIPRQFGYSKGLDFCSSFDHYEWPKGNFSLRPGQKEAIEGVYKGLKDSKGGITELHTGFGKTLIALAVASKLKTNVLVIAHKSDLLEQFRQAAKKFYGIDCGWVQDDTLDYKGKLITVATVQTLYSRRDSIPKDFWEHFGFVVADEGHRMPSMTFTEVFGKLSAKYRLGMSATFRRFDKLDKIWEWHIGNIIYADGKKGLKGRYLQHFVPLNISQKWFSYGSKLNVAKMVTYIGNLEQYNRVIAQTAVKLVSQGRQVLIASDRTEQLVELSKLLEPSQFGFYVGALPVNGKKKLVSQEKLEEAKTKPIILATFKKVAEGSDIPSLDSLILATPRGDIEQVAGRIRREYPGKKTPLIVDFVFKTSYNYALANMRKRMYEKIGFQKVSSIGD